MRAEYAKLAGELQGLVAPDGTGQGQVDRLLAQAAAVRDAQLVRLGERAAQAVLTGNLIRR